MEVVGRGFNDGYARIENPTPLRRRLFGVGLKSGRGAGGRLWGKTKSPPYENAPTAAVAEKGGATVEIEKSPYENAPPAAAVGVGWWVMADLFSVPPTARGGGLWVRGEGLTFFRAKKRPRISSRSF